MEAPHEILALARVDPGLAADGTVDLGEEGRRDLHEIDSAQDDAGGKAGQISDHAAAECDECRGALNAPGEKPIDQRFEMREILRGLSGGQDDIFMGDPGAVEGGSELGQIRRGVCL